MSIHRDIQVVQKVLSNETPITYTPIRDYLFDFSIVLGYIKLFKSILTLYYRDKYIQRRIDGMYEDMTYYPQHENRMYSANVKLYHIGYDLDDAIKELGLKKAEEESVREEFTDNVIEEIFWDWIEFERDNLKYDISQTYNFSLNEMGFYGRMGGHFCLCDATPCIEYRSSGWDSMEEFCDKIMDEYEWKDISVEYIQEEIDDIHADQDEMITYLNKVKNALKFAEEYSKGLDFSYELKYRIEEFLEEKK
ncbi:MAG: hypothetical protein ACW96U_00790 [Candidatus Heimdallarchaeaceae archaeon]|jgi:DNA-binding ferritin-like protein (Dps family)